MQTNQNPSEENKPIEGTSPDPKEVKPETEKKQEEGYSIVALAVAAILGAVLANLYNNSKQERQVVSLKNIKTKKGPEIYEDTETYPDYTVQFRKKGNEFDADDTIHIRL